MATDVARIKTEAAASTALTLADDDLQTLAMIKAPTMAALPARKKFAPITSATRKSAVLVRIAESTTRKDARLRTNVTAAQTIIRLHDRTAELSSNPGKDVKGVVTNRRNATPPITRDCEESVKPRRTTDRKAKRSSSLVTTINLRRTAPHRELRAHRKPEPAIADCGRRASGP